VRRVLAGLLIAALFLAACGTGSGASAAPTPSASAPSGPPESPIEGVVLEVNASSLSEVSTFTLRADDGRSWEFEVGPLENATEFPPAHLHEHQASSTPVRVFFRSEPSRLVAYRIEDAGE
jgi:hypothetical protein